MKIKGSRATLLLEKSVDELPPLRLAQLRYAREEDRWRLYLPGPGRAWLEDATEPTRYVDELLRVVGELTREWMTAKRMLAPQRP